MGSVDHTARRIRERVQVNQSRIVRFHAAHVAQHLQICVQDCPTEILFLEADELARHDVLDATISPIEDDLAALEDENQVARDWITGRHGQDPFWGYFGRKQPTTQPRLGPSERIRAGLFIEPRGLTTKALRH